MDTLQSGGAAASHGRGRSTAGVTTAEELTREFTEFRPRLLGIAYRMLGSIWDAEDVVADAMVRWLAVDRTIVREPLAFLTTIVTRRALDQLRSARRARETYVGEWLPEPLLTEPSPLGPLDTVERREAVSLATLRLMEALTPPERAVLVLHEAFELTHAEIGDVLDISEEGARQHLRRARTHLGGDAKRTRAVPAVHDMCIDRFLDALVRGDLSAVQDLLATDVVSYSDGGGKVRAARRRVIGAHRVEYFFASLRRRQPVRDVRMIEINGRRAAVLWFGQHQQVLALHVADGKITEIYSIRNPDKLQYLEQQLGHDRPPSVPGAA